VTTPAKRLYRTERTLTRSLRVAYPSGGPARRDDGFALQGDARPADHAQDGRAQRPSLRAYVTWARWSEGFVGLVAPILYGEASRGFAAGVQIETWW